MKQSITFIPVILLLTAAVVLIAVNSKSAPEGNRVRIVAGENFWGDIASQIAGTQGTVVSIISNPSQDPHTYEPTTSDARHVSDADIIIENGAGYDSFMQKLLSTAGAKTIINAGSIAGLHSGDNPHIWYSLPYVRAVARILRNDLSSRDPAHTAVYETNYTHFIGSLGVIDTVCRQISTMYIGTPVIATERVANFMLTNCGLFPIPNDFQKAVEEGTDPSIEAMQYFQEKLNSREARLLIYNKQTVSSITDKMKSLASSRTIPVIGVTETMPLHSTYQQWMLSEIQAIEKGLQNER